MKTFLSLKKNKNVTTVRLLVDLGEYLDDVRVVNAGHDLGADPEDVVPGHGGPPAVPPVKSE